MTRGPKAGTARNAADLLRRKLIPSDRAADVDRVSERYETAIPDDLLRLIDPADPADPIARQFVPSAEELSVLPTQESDPTGDQAHSPVKGIVHRYPDRVLFKPVHVCPVYCRYCFRRERVGKGGDALSPAETKVALDYIENNPSIWEVIFSGGDPFVLSNRRLGDLISQLTAMPHVEVLRFHTRFPVARPSRIDQALVEVLKVHPATHVVVHCNHPRELTDSVVRACGALIDRGIPVLSQTVLLRGVNDDPQTLRDLLRRLVVARIKPYYLHHLDRAPGTAHFGTRVEDGQALMRGLRGDVSGLCQPHYVLDIPGGSGKVPIGPNYLHRDGDRYRVEDVHGAEHIYKDDVSP